MKLTVYYPLRVSCNCRLGGMEASYSRRAFRSYHNDTDELNISANRMPTSEQETGESEKTTDKWEGACGSPSAASDGAGGDARVPPELRAALPNVVWSTQEEKPDGQQGLAKRFPIRWGQAETRPTGKGPQGSDDQVDWAMVLSHTRDDVSAPLVKQEIAPGGFQPMRVPKPQLLRDVILNECRDREVRSASDGDYHRFAE